MREEMPSSAASDCACRSHGASVTRSVRRDIHCTAISPRRVFQEQAARQSSTLREELPTMTADSVRQKMRPQRLSAASRTPSSRCAGSLTRDWRLAADDSQQTPSWKLGAASWKLEAAIFNRHQIQLPARQRNRQRGQDEHARERERPDHVPKRCRSPAEQERDETCDGKEQRGFDDDVSHWYPRDSQVDR